MASIPLQRSKAWLEDKGWHVWVTEYWNSWAHVRVDLYNLIDFVAIRHDNPGVWGINACEDDGAVQGHVNRYLNGYDHQKKGRVGPNPHLPVWLSAGNRFSLFGWGKRSQDGRGSRKVWTLRVVEFYLDGAQVKTREVLSEALAISAQSPSRPAVADPLPDLPGSGVDPVLKAFQKDGIVE